MDNGARHAVVPGSVGGPGAHRRDQRHQGVRPARIELFDFGDVTSSELVASLAPGARVVKAFNHLPFEQMMSPVAAGHRRVLFVSGDDADAKASVMSVIRANGFAAVDLGSLAS